MLFYLILFQNVKNYFKINQLIEYNDDFTLNLTANFFGMYFKIDIISYLKLFSNKNKNNLLFFLVAEKK